MVEKASCIGASTQNRGVCLPILDVKKELGDIALDGIARFMYGRPKNDVQYSEFEIESFTKNILNSLI